MIQRTWSQIQNDFLVLFPELESTGTWGRIIRGCLHDASVKWIFLFNEKDSERYHKEFKSDPLRGFQVWLDMGEDILEIYRETKAYLKETPRVSIDDFAGVIARRKRQAQA